MTPTTEELKPCPFCGGEAETAHVGKYAVCRNCDAAPSTLIRSEVWNSRPAGQALAARVVELEAEVERLQAPRSDVYAQGICAALRQDGYFVPYTVMMRAMQAAPEEGKSNG